MMKYRTVTWFFFSLMVGSVMFLMYSSSGFAADWPMWRFDASRSGSTTEKLSTDLSLQWIRQYPAFPPVWTIDGSDMVYTPIVLGKTMFVGSPVNDSLSAIDVETGKEKWRFYTEGPIRLAPAGWKGRVFVTSDDGFLYCVNATDGKLIWRFRGGPKKNRVIGDERLVSAWPARGGPVVVSSSISGQATVYFAASIYPFMGIYVYALDAETGKVVWVNDGRGENWQWKGEKTAPQGSLAVVGNKILIPNNWLGITCLDRTTGKFSYFASTRSLWNVCGSGKYFFAETTGRHGGRGGSVHDLDTGSLMGSLSFSPVLSGGIAFKAEGDDSRASVGALDLSKLETVTVKRKPSAKIPSLWSLGKFKKVGRKALRVRLKAGPRLYVTDGNRVVAVDIPSEGKEAKESWVGVVKGEVGDMLAAAGRLFVVTRDGSIYCFGSKKVEAKTYAVAHKDLPVASKMDVAKAKKILAVTGVRDGYAIVAGIGTGRFVEELLRQSKLMLVVVDPDARKVDSLRRRLDAAGLYGARATVLVGDPSDCGLPSYMASLIVSDDPKVHIPFRSLRPYGGVACVQGSKVAVAGWVKKAKIQNTKIEQVGKLVLVRREGALPGSAPWTHQYADSGNTVSSKDDLVRAPLGLLWFGGASSRLSFDRHHFGPRPHVVGGRMFVFGPAGLTAIDVYTGRFLWHAKSPEVLSMTKPYDHKRAYRLPGSNYMGSYYASVADGVYVAAGRTCLRLDPATGKKISEIPLHSAGATDKRGFGPIRIFKDVLVAAVDPIIDNLKLFGKSKWNGAASRQIAAFDRNTGKALWSFDAKQGFCHNAIAIGGGMVFCVDRWAKDAKSKAEGGELLALDVRTGKVAWSTKKDVYGTWVAYSSDTGLVLQSAGMRGKKKSNGSRGIAYRGKDGTVVWDAKIGAGPWMLNGNMLIAQGRSAFDLRTGKKTKKFGAVGGKGCDYDICGTHLITNREGSAAYVDIDTNIPYRLGGVRSGCLNTLIPADGVLNHPFFAINCTCPLNIRASLALIHMPELVLRTGKKKK
ncbi:MAG: PQQ-binding-like beta-propeller repeat protein [Kiritimatiellae bacterium]|nr:PQQ-binding-like beta-propeller repeat protein [Kiritimatiellia bacterium]